MSDILSCPLKPTSASHTGCPCKSSPRLAEMNRKQGTVCDCSQPLRSHRYVRPCSQGSLHSLYTIHKHTLTLARTRFRTLTLTFFLFSLFQSLYLFCVALILTCSLSLSVCSVSQSRTHFRMQALRIDFDMVSTSEINPDFRDFFYGQRRWQLQACSCQH